MDNLLTDLANLPLNELKQEYRKRFLFYKPHQKQFLFHAAGASAFERAFFGGNRTGKSFSAYMEAAIHATGYYPDWWIGKKFLLPTNGLIACPSYQACRDVAQSYLLGGYDPSGTVVESLISLDLILEKGMLTGVRGAIDYIKINHISNGYSTIYFKSSEQRREKFQGTRFDWALIDEECPADIYREILMRLADVDGRGQGIMMLAMTPLKGMTELMKHYLVLPISKMETTQSSDIFSTDYSEEKATPGVVMNNRFFLQVSWDDNPHFTELAKEAYLATIPAYELEARQKGIPLIGTGLVYQVPEYKFLIDPIEIQPHWHHVIGLDLGFNPAPTAAVFCAWDKDNDTLYIYKEYYVTQNTPQQHVYNFNIMDCLWIPFIADPSARIGSATDGKKAIEEYAKSGKELVIAKYAKEMATTRVLERIRNNKFKVFNSCHKFLQEWRTYARDDKGKIMKGNDHLMNALEFIISDGLPYAITKTQYEMQYNYKSKRILF